MYNIQIYKHGGYICVKCLSRIMYNIYTLND